MRTDAILRGQQVVLVPSTPDHVKTYYRWMSDPQLLRDTGTEPLSLEEVYQMEKHWREDPDKLTFIILASQEGVADITSLPMVGDVNIFFKGDPGDRDFEAEVGVMIAEKNYRRRGMAFEALRLMLSYVTGSPSSFARPALSPTPNPPFPSPIRLFKRLGFVETNGVNAFGEKEMRLPEGDR